MNGDIKKSSRTLVSTPRVPGTIRKCNEKSVPVSKCKVAIIGDSHLKGSAPRIDNLSSKFEVSGFIKPGASFEKIVGESNLRLSRLKTKMRLYVMVVPMICTLVTQRK